MELKEYQKKVVKALGDYRNPLYPFLALPATVGAFTELSALYARGGSLEGKFKSSFDYDQTMLKEAGRILETLALCLDGCGLKLEDALQASEKHLTQTL